MRKSHEKPLNECTERKEFRKIAVIEENESTRREKSKKAVLRQVIALGDPSGERTIRQNRRIKNEINGKTRKNVEEAGETKGDQMAQSPQKKKREVILRRGWVEGVRGGGGGGGGGVAGGGGGGGGGGILRSLEERGKSGDRTKKGNT